ncbi:MAG: DNA repair protein RecN [Oscillospiraceae bacterium]|jgi:DNA repair protein RecN (Recombination protein N)|nr:DNA repair protein RecN [Oscillospiraceae bacterium]
MLRELHIENIAIIEAVDITFRPGFNVMTGETGAGKSIIIDSLDAVLGGRTSRELVRHGAEKARVTAVFDPEGTEQWLEENEIDPEDELILQRRISADGKSACRVNSVPVSVAQLRELGNLLLSIHGQNDGRQLMDEARHLAYLDAFGGYTAELDAFHAAYADYREMVKAMERLVMDEDEKQRRIESLEYRVSELSKADLQAGEEAQLEARAELMRNGEKLSESLGGAFAALYAGDVNALGLVTDAQFSLNRVKGYTSELSGAAESLEQARLLLDDVSEQIRDVLGTLDFSPEEFDRVETRLAQLKKLEKRFGADEAGLIAMLEEGRQALEEIQSGDELLSLQKKRAAEKREQARKCAAELTKRRQAAGEQLAQRIQAELSYLSMPSVRFVTEVLPVEQEDGFVSTGGDVVRFLISANAGEAPGRISKIASGGELSRIMLAMKSVFAEKDPVPTLVFDEIDTGISGVAAQRVAEKIAAISRGTQVICVTHLPQLAAMGDVNFCIEKEEKQGRTFTSVMPLDYNGKLREIARLQSGDLATQTALASAEELTAAADRFKENL